MKLALPLAVVVVGAAFSSCNCQPQPGGTVAGSAPASDYMAPLAGVATYDYALHSQSDLTVELRDGAGGDRGTLVVTTGAGDTATTVTLADGTQAVQHLAYTLVPTGGYWLRVRLEASGQALEIDALADDAHTPQQILLATAGDPVAGASGAAGPDGANDVFAVLDGNGPASDQAIAAWFAAAPIGALLGNRAVPLLVGATRDPRLLAAVAQQMPPASGVLTEALHGTPDCMTVNSVLGGSSIVGNPLCQTCAAVIIAAAAVPGNSLTSAVGAVSCGGCLLTIGVGVVQAARCWLAARRAPTDGECRMSCPPTDKAMVDTIKDECVCTCDDAMCKQQAAMQVRNGAVLCNAGCLSDRCQIHIQKCGNGRVENTDGCNEACDPLAQPTGCKNGEQCANDCTCQLLRDASAPPDLAAVDAATDAAALVDASDDAEGALCHDHMGIPFHCLAGLQCIACHGEESCQPLDVYCCGDYVLCGPPGVCHQCVNAPYFCDIPPSVCGGGNF